MLFVCFFEWLVGWLIGWSVGRSVGWLVGCLCVCIFCVLCVLCVLFMLLFVCVFVCLLGYVLSCSLACYLVCFCLSLSLMFVGFPRRFFLGVCVCSAFLFSPDGRARWWHRMGAWVLPIRRRVARRPILHRAVVRLQAKKKEGRKEGR